MVLLLLLWIFAIAATRIGWNAGAWPKKWATLLAAGFCLGLVAGAAMSWRLEWMPEFLIRPTTAMLQGSWFAPLALGLFFIAARQSVARDEKEGRKTRTVALFKVLSAVVLAISTIGLIDRLDWYSGVSADMSAEGKIDSDGVVRQTTGYTCGPAACATLLRMVGADPNASERQLAPLCITRRWDGATLLGMAAGVKSVAGPGGWHVKLARADWDALNRMKMPVLTSVKINDATGHAVVITGVDSEKGVRIADPISGLYWCSEKEFRARFDQETLSLYRDDG
jgi:predicted double-glycine peptidase